jgi:hypothetical protein
MRAQTFKYDGFTYKLSKNEGTEKFYITCVDTSEVLVWKVDSKEIALMELGMFLQKSGRA